MRAITTAQAAVLASGTQAEFVRLSVKDAGGTFRDLTTYPGFNAVRMVSWRAGINDPHATFDAQIERELFSLSLAPLMEDSALNRGFVPSNDYAPLLKLNREVKIEAAIVPMDSQPGAGDWMEVFRGRIDEIDSAAGPNIAISGRDLGGRLAQQYIKKERVYAFASVDGAAISLRIWKPEMLVTDGEYILPATRGDEDLGFAKFYVVATAGQTGLTEPDWTGGAGIVDGTAVFDYAGTPDLGGFPVQDIIQLILDDNRLSGDAAVTLEVEDDPLWDITEFMQQRGFTLDATRALATQIGFDLRYKWKESAGAFLFTIYEPERDDPTVLYEFGPSDYLEPKKLSTAIAELRNSVLVIIKDKENLYPDGTAIRVEVTDSDPDSIDDNGELWSELQEDQLGNIDTITEAERLAAAFVSDCATPDAQLSVPLARGFPWVELNDFDRFLADGVRSSAALELAVTSWEQVFESRHLSTKLEVRGKPTIGHIVHLEREHHPKRPNKVTPHRMEHFQAPKTVNPDFIPIVGGIQVSFPTGSQAKKESLLSEYEIHVSDTPDFTPSDTTLVSVIKGTSQSIPYQVPGQDLYGCTVPRWYNAGQLVRGQPSKRKAFTAGRGGAGHLEQFVEWGRMPLNGGFETWNDLGTLPDHWKTQQTWGVNFERASGAGGVSGDAWLRFNVQLLGIANIFTNQFTVEKTTSYDVTWWANIFDAGTLGSVSLNVTWFDHNGDLLSSDQVDLIAFDQADMVAGTWYRRGGTVTAPEDARFASVQLKQETNGNMVLDVDSVRFDRA